MFWISPFVPKTLEVTVTADKWTNTGLVYPNGQPIYKVEYREPIGFIHFPRDPDAQENS